VCGIGNRQLGALTLGQGRVAGTAQRHPQRHPTDRGYRSLVSRRVLPRRCGLALERVRKSRRVVCRRGSSPHGLGSSGGRRGSSAAARSQICKTTRPRRGFAHGESAGPRTPSEIIQSAGGREPHPGEETTRDMHAQRAAEAIGQGSASAGHSRPTIRPDQPGGQGGGIANRRARRGTLEEHRSPHGHRNRRMFVTVRGLSRGSFPPSVG
jgi:hypothetical protein